MIIFRVVREQHGWAVRAGECTTAPFWSREAAVREANCLVEAIRRHGEPARVSIEGGDADAARGRVVDTSSSRPDAPPRGYGTAPR